MNGEGSSRGHRRAVLNAMRRGGNVHAMPSSWSVLRMSRNLMTAWREHAEAVAGVCDEISQGDYTPRQGLADAFALGKSWLRSACDLTCHSPDELTTNETSEAAGPVWVGHYSGLLDELTCTDLLHADGSVLSWDHVKLRKVGPNRLLVTLVDLFDLAPRLSEGMYLGEVINDRSRRVAKLALRHRRLSRNRTIDVAFSF